MKKSLVFSIIISMAMFGTGLFFPMPEKELEVSSYSYSTNWGKSGIEYVGGDAYNYQMEASLTAGWVSGVMAFKGILIASGLILFALTIMLEAKSDEIKSQASILNKLISCNTYIKQEKEEGSL